MPSYAIVYTCCKANKGGDYAAAAKQAYALKKTLPETTSLIFMSTPQGIAKFRKMFPCEMGGTLANLWGLQVATLSIADAKADISPSDVSHFMEVGWCKPLDDANIRHWCRPHVTVTFMGLACYDDTAGTTLDICLRHPSTFLTAGTPTSPRKIRHLGFGPDRCGQPIISPRLPVLAATTSRILGSTQFGFAYLDCTDLKGYDQSVKTFKQYLMLLSKAELTNAVVVIAPTETTRATIVHYLSSYQ